MKKKHEDQRDWLNPGHSKTLKVMKLTGVLILSGFLTLSAKTVSQNATVTINVENEELAKVFDAIEAQTDYVLFYKKDVVDDAQKITLKVKDESVKQVLNKVLNTNQVTYSMMDNSIIIAPAKLMQNMQVQKVTGTITDSKGDPLPGVSVLIKGTTIGTITDTEGKYSIETKSEATLVFSFIGFKNQEVVVGQQTLLNITLEDETFGMSEVVVVGYGVQKRSDITGSVTSVPSDRLSRVPVTNLTHAIEGSTAGLNVVQTSSVPGSTSEMQIRGVNSINANTSPFIVLDGIPFFGSTNDINPNDILSIEILKDASAVAIYGTRGANGVILISTKKGLKGEGKPTINYNGNMGLQSMSHVLTPMSPDAYVQKYADYNKANGLTQTAVLPNASEVENYENGITYDWMDEVSQPGMLQDHNLSLSGGTDNVQYFLSGGYLNEKGVVKGYQYKRTSFRTNIDAKITDYLKIGTSSFITNNNYDGGRVNFLEANAMSPYSVPYDENGNYIIYPMAPEQLFLNPLLGLTKDRLNRGLNLTGSGYAEVTPKFAKGLKYRLNASYIYNIGRTADYSGRAANDQSGTANVSNTVSENWVVENILSYTKDIEKHHFDVTGLYSAQKVDYFKSWGQSKTFINDALKYYNMSAGVSQSNDSEGNSYSLCSQMGRLNYSFDSRYLFTVTARRDGYSAFGANTDKYGLFPSVAVGWNIANESFMADMDKIQQLKLRFSYGETGNMAIGVNQTASTASTVQYPFAGTAYTGVLYNTLGNADLNWESTTATNIGVDFSLFKFRVSGSVEAYKTVTEDILLKRKLPTITGYSEIWDNLGRMQNIGFDFTLKTINIKNQDFTWSTDLNFSTYKNELLELYGDGKDDVGNEWFIGHPVDVIYDYEKIGIWQTGEDASKSDPQAKPGDLKYKDQLTVDTDGDGVADAGDGVITADDKIITGQEDPNWIGGMTNTFSYKNFTLSIFIQTSQGGLKSNKDLSYADEAWRRNLPADFKYWTPENPSNYWPSLSAYKNYRGYRFAEDWSYVRIKDITLSYNVPQSFLDKYKIGNLTVFASGRNLYTFTNWFGWDPEMTYDSRGSGNWTNNYPPVRTISFGLNLSL